MIFFFDVINSISRQSLIVKEIERSYVISLDNHEFYKKSNISKKKLGTNTKTHG